MNSAIRGACPGIATPMPTGDGLLARLVPHEPIGLDAFVALCAASQKHGNGIIEVTQRGSLQVRGLDEESACLFATIVTALGIGAINGPPLVTSPLLGLDACEMFDSHALVVTLSRALAEQPRRAAPGPKVSVLIDGSGGLHLQAVPADIRLQATPDSRFQLALGGDARTAVHMGCVEFNNVVPIIAELLALIASRGTSARARDLMGAKEIGALRSTVGEWLTESPNSMPDQRPPAEPIGLHPLRTGSVARGFALAFGHTTAAALQRLAHAAMDRGATSIRPAPGRALLVIGLSHAAADDLRAVALAEGFVVEPNDLRRRVVACAGAPACASATLPTRQLAPQVACAIRMLAGIDKKIVHLSGCSKGCAHPGKAAITVVGPDRLIFDGRAGDAPHGFISSAGLIADLERLCAGANHA